MASAVPPVTLAVCWLRVFADLWSWRLVCRVTEASRAVCCNISLLPGLKQQMEREASERASLWRREGEGREESEGKGWVGGGDRGESAGACLALTRTPICLAGHPPWDRVSGSRQLIPVPQASSRGPWICRL